MKIKRAQGPASARLCQARLRLWGGSGLVLLLLGWASAQERPPSPAQTNPATTPTPTPDKTLEACQKDIQQSWVSERGSPQKFECSTEYATAVSSALDRATSHLALTEATQQQLTCLQELAKKHACAQLACHIAFLFEDLSKRQPGGLSPQEKQLSTQYATACLSCVRSDRFTTDFRKSVEQQQPPPPRLNNTLLYGIGGTLLGLGLGSMAAGIGLIPFRNNPNGLMTCMSGGLPVECKNNFDAPIGWTLGLGSAAASLGALVLHYGCQKCRNHVRLLLPAPSPSGGTP